MGKIYTANTTHFTTANKIDGVVILSNMWARDRQSNSQNTGETDAHRALTLTGSHNGLTLNNRTGS